MSVESCRIINLPKVPDARGNLSFIEGEKHVPFPIRRVFYLYDVPGGESRAGHALRSCHQFIVAISGSFDVSLDDGLSKATHQLNRSYYGLHIPPRVWRVLDNFSSGAVCLVLASEAYDPRSYYRDYEEFVRLARGDGDGQATLS
jgi:WxcM-like, C-terminal